MRYLYITCIVLLSALVLLIGWRAVANPLDDEREWVAREIANIPPTGAGDGEEDAPSEWEKEILSKPTLWQQLVAPPAAPPPAAPAPPKPPDLRKMLEGVQASTRKVGDSVFMAWPGNEKGSFVAVGEKVKGCTLKAIERDKVVFSLFWEKGNAEIVYSIPRHRKIN